MVLCSRVGLEVMMVVVLYARVECEMVVGVVVVLCAHVVVVAELCAHVECVTMMTG